MKIGKYKIKNNGNYSVYTDGKIKSKNSEVKTKEVLIASYGFLKLCLSFIGANGNRIEKNEATEVFDALNEKLNNNKAKDNDEHMIEYRKIESKFYENYSEKEVK